MPDNGEKGLARKYFPNGTICFGEVPDANPTLLNTLPCQSKA